LLESKKNFSANFKDSIHDLSDTDLEETENNIEGNGWTTLFKPELSISNLTSSERIESVSGLSRPSFEIGILYPPSKYNEDGIDSLTRQGSRVPGLNQYYAPSVGYYYGTGPLIFPNGEMSVLVPNPNPNPPVPNTNPPVPNTNPSVPNTNPPAMVLPQSPTNPQEPIIIIPESSDIMNVQIPTPSSQQPIIDLSKLNWGRFGLFLAFIKLGLVKLKLLGFEKILLFFLFKLKLFLILVFFKTILVFNMLLFSKFVVLPLFLLPIFSIIVSIISPTFMVGLLSIPGKITKNMVLGPAYFGRLDPASTIATETSSSISALSSPLS